MSSSLKVFFPNPSFQRLFDRTFEQSRQAIKVFIEEKILFPPSKWNFDSSFSSSWNNQSAASILLRSNRERADGFVKVNTLIFVRNHMFGINFKEIMAKKVIEMHFPSSSSFSRPYFQNKNDFSSFILIFFSFCVLCDLWHQLPERIVRE